MEIFESEKFDEYAEPFSTGETIFEEGEPGDGFYIIKEGTVDVLTETDGRRMVLATLGPGEMFGEMALIGDVEQRTATVKANSRAIALRFDRDVFLNFLSNSERFREFVLEFLVERLIETSERVQRMGKYTSSMLDSSHLMLALMDQIDWYTETRKDLKVNISESLVQKKFDLDEKTVHRMLAIKDSAELSRFPSNIQDEILNASETILDEGFEKLDIEFPAAEYDASRTFGGEVKSLDEMLKATKQLTSILNNSERLTRTQYEKIYDQYRTLKERFENEETDRSGRSDPSTVHKLNAHLDALNRKLKEFDLHELDDRE